MRGAADVGGYSARGGCCSVVGALPRRIIRRSCSHRGGVAGTAVPHQASRQRTSPLKGAPLRPSPFRLHPTLAGTVGTPSHTPARTRAPTHAHAHISHRCVRCCGAVVGDWGSVGCARRGPRVGYCEGTRAFACRFARRARLASAVPRLFSAAAAIWRLAMGSTCCAPRRSRACLSYGG